MRRAGRMMRIFSLVAFLAIFALCGVLFYGLRNTSEQLEAARQRLDSNTQTVYVATADIKAGEVVLADVEDSNLEQQTEDSNLEKQTILTGIEDYNYITEEDLGKVATVDIDYGMPVLTNMVTDAEITKDARDYECSVATLMVDQAEYDTVDVRISFPTGEDYIVLSKKLIENMDLPNCIFYTQLNEEEILRMQSAIIDAYMTEGCRIYTTRYIERNLQDEAVPTYPVREATYDLITNDKLDPNVLTVAKRTLSVQARLDLEKRLGELTEEEVEAVKGKVEAQEALLREIMGSQSEFTGEEVTTEAPAEGAEYSE